MNKLAIKQERVRYLDRLQDPTLFREFAYINGEWCAGDNGNTLDVCNPADGSCLGAVANISENQSRAAVDAAQRAFAQWSMQLPQQRSALLRRWSELMLEHKQDLALSMKRMKHLSGQMILNMAWWLMSIPATRGEFTISPAHFNTAWLPSIAPR